MKKQFVIVALVASSIVAASADTKTFTVPKRTREHPQRRQPTLPGTKAIGAFPRAARNPIQMINPRAPWRYYGPPQETVVYDPMNYEADHRPRITGLILFGFAW